MKIIAVDDEKIALQGLILSIQKSAPNAEIYGFRHTGEAIAHMEKDPCDVAFLDIEMKGMNGVTVAEKLKAINPDVYIIFATGFGSYRDAAIDLHASGYLIKPITAESVKRELDNLRRPVTPPKRLQIFTFGNFEVLYNNTPLKFKYQKTKEMLAYLIDRQGSVCTMANLIKVLWGEGGEDASRQSNLRNLIADLKSSLSSVQSEEIIIKDKNGIAVDCNKIKCDYYDYMQNKAYAVNKYRGEYMSQYAWAKISKRK